MLGAAPSAAPSAVLRSDHARPASRASKPALLAGHPAERCDMRDDIATAGSKSGQPPLGAPGRWVPSRGTLEWAAQQQRAWAVSAASDGERIERSAASIRLFEERVAPPNLALGRFRRQAVVVTGGSYVVEGDPTRPVEAPAETAATVVDPPPLPSAAGGRVPSRRGRPHKRNVRGLTVNQWLIAHFLIHPEDGQLSERRLEDIARKHGCDWSARTIGRCSVRRKQQKICKAVAEADNRAAADDLGEDLEANGLHLHKRKHNTGRQRQKSSADRSEELADRAHDADTDAFIAKADGKRQSPK